MTQAIIAIFIGLYMVEEFNISFRLGYWINEKIWDWKLFKCLPCFTFWSSIVVGIIFVTFFYSTIFESIINSMLAFIVAAFLTHRKK